MLIVAGTLNVDPARRDEFIKERVDSMKSARAEAGCLNFVMSADPVEPGRVCLFELWASQAHLDDHLAGLRAAKDAGSSATPQVASQGSTVLKYEIASSGPLH